MGWGGLDWEFGINRRKLLYEYIEWVNKKALMCWAENYIQYPVINHSEKGYKKNIKGNGYPLQYSCLENSMD